MGTGCLISSSDSIGDLQLSEDLGMSLINSVDFDSTSLPSDQLTQHTFIVTRRQLVLLAAVDLKWWNVSIREVKKIIEVR